MEAARLDPRGAVAAIGDSAAGYAALTLMPPGVGVLTTEFKINLVAPAGGEGIVVAPQARQSPAGRSPRRRRRSSPKRVGRKGWWRFSLRR